MNAWQFIKRGIWYYRISYLGVLAGAALGATVLLGALFAGDSVKSTLGRIASDRIGQVDHLFASGEGFFRDELAQQLVNDGLRASPILIMRGQLSSQQSGRGLGEVQIVGVEESFWSFAPDSSTRIEMKNREAVVNGHLAASLGLAAGDTVVMRMQEPGLLSRDAPLSGEAEEVISFRATVRDIVQDDRFGRFSLASTQLPVATVFLPLARLQEVIEFPGKANIILINSGGAEPEGGLAEFVRQRMTLRDYGFSLVDVPLAEATELRSERIFFEPRVVEVVRGRYPGVQPVISYLANTLEVAGKKTPYSMVTATVPGAVPFLPNDLAADEVVINQWLADDLGAKEGDELSMDYFQLGHANRLVESNAKFRVRGVVTLEGLAADRLWMPDFPGVAEAENPREWASGLPLDLDRIRDKDEDYWEAHRGTPKAFLKLERGAELFGNRWGQYSSLRIPTTVADRDEVGASLLPVLRPEMSGILLRSFREEALTAAQSPVDIGQLFLYMSFFLIVASVSLTAMLFRFNVEQRNRESGLLAAVGVAPKKILRWRLLEAFCIVTVGGVIGAIVAVAYSIGILRFLETIWSAGDGGSFFTFHLGAGSLVIGLAAFVLLSMAAVWLAVRKQARSSASMRLEAGAEEVERGGRRRRDVVLAAAFLVAGAGALAAREAMGPQRAFFLAGMCFLIAGLAGYRAWLAWRGEQATTVVDPRSLAALNSGRRPMRSLVVVGTLACGVFLVVAVTSFQKHSGDELMERSSGTGGFGFWVETTSPVNRTANAGEDPDYFELGDDRGLLGEIVPFRVGVGDDASCFNLNTAMRPRLLAVQAGKLAERESFALKGVAKGLAKNQGWRLLQEKRGGRVLPAFLDETTLMWVLKKKIGDRITYQDEFGADFEVEITGTLADSVFQGSFVVDEASFLQFFPSQEGYRLFLADAAGDADADADATATIAAIQKSTADRGGTVSATRARLESFHAVENTYIAIFHVLGGLGLLLGSAGIGIVTARNLAERRNEFEVLRTVGIPHRVSRSVIFSEIRGFIGWALLIGLLAAVVAIVPVLTGTPPVKTLVGLGILVVAIALNSLLWAWFGYRAGYRRAG